jgi:hypothetical protein
VRALRVALKVRNDATKADHATIISGPDTPNR